MSINWHLVHTTGDHVEAEILRGMLERNQVPVTLLNRKDSSYVFLGVVEIYVPSHLKDIAVALIGGTFGN